MEILCSNVSFEFQQFFQDSLFSIWRWKLDPWNMEAPIQSMKGMQKIVVTSKKNCERSKDVQHIVYEENSGFFKHRVSKLQTEETLWELIRVAKKRSELQFLVNAEWNKITLLEDQTNTSQEVAFEYLGRIMPGVLLQHGILSFHGVLMEHNGEGIIISAPSGTGKTTHARLWRDFKHALIINGDYAAIEKDGDDWYGFGLPWSGTSGEAVNRRVKIKAFVVLERAKKNRAYPIEGLEAFDSVFPHVKCPKWEKPLTMKMLDLLDEFLKDIVVIRLQCKPDKESVDVLNNVYKERV